MPERTLIKCCGLRSEADVAAVSSAGADFAGFIMTERFWRYVSPGRVAVLHSRLDPRITAVGVFVNEPVGYVAAQLNSGTIDMAQLHGSEDDEYISALRGLINTSDNVRMGNIVRGRIIKAFKVTSGEDIRRACASAADYILLDSGTGTGRTFDWSLMSDIGRPYFFAGGLDPDNVADVVTRFRPFAVDVSSGIETDRHKDADKIQAFVSGARRASI